MVLFKSVTHIVAAVAVFGSIAAMDHIASAQELDAAGRLAARRAIARTAQGHTPRAGRAPEEPRESGCRQLNGPRWSRRKWHRKNPSPCRNMSYPMSASSASGSTSDRKVFHFLQPFQLKLIPNRLEP